MTTDSLTSIFSKLAFKVHPKLGRLYDEHTQFLNDGFVELICLIIANAFVWMFSYYFIGPALVLVLLLVSTPITFGLKYVLHKFWVWKK